MATLSELLVDESHYRIDEWPAGRGPWGIMYEGTLLPRNGKGQIDITVFISDEKDFALFSGEIEVLHELNHPGCLKLLGFSPRRSAESASPVMITKWIADRSLEDALKRDLNANPFAGWNATKKSICVFGMAAILKYIHSKNMIRYDIKPANFLLNENFEPVLCFFGLPLFVCHGINVDAFAFMAPELFMDEGRDKKSNAADVYAFGISLLYFFAKTGKFDDKNGDIESSADLMSRVRKGARPQRPNGMSDFYWNLARRCWDQEPSQRPTAAQIVSELRSHRYDYAFPGAVLRELVTYENMILGWETRATTNRESKSHPF
jgi:serine/threonine protein kinase